MLITPKKSINKILDMPGDKSIFHRACLLASLAQGDSIIKNAPDNLDCMSTLVCLKELGVQYKLENNTCIIQGQTIKKFKQPNTPLFAGNSGTTARLLSGILANLPFSSVLIGDESLSARPMNRIIKPLEHMGAKINSNGTLPLEFAPSVLNGINYETKISSAQVKSSVLLAGILAEGETSVTEKLKTRDHLENLFTLSGIKYTRENSKTTITGKQTPGNFNINLCGDFSSAAYFIALALILKNSEITITNIGLNKTRIGFLNIIKKMGANFKIENIKYPIPNEPNGDITIKSNELKGVTIEAEEVPSVIDELPVIAVLASQANGITEISGAGELRFKESDRISVIVKELKKMNADITEKQDGFIINGKKELTGATVNSHGDHRIAMSLAIAGSLAKGETFIENSRCVNISFPDFFEILDKI